MINKLKKHYNLDIFKLVFGIVLIIISLRFIVFYGHKLNTGRILVFSTGTLLILSNFLKQKFKHILNILFLIIAIIYVIMLLVLCFGFNRYDGINNNQTVIVLGAGIKQDKPGIDLTSRLDKTIEFLNKNPNSKCIVTGGLDKKYEIYESDVMKNYLISKGISENRIYQEKSSTNTKENFIYAKEIIEKENLNKNTVVVTNFYHQFRSSLYAKIIGFNFQGLSSFSKPSDFICASVREMFGILKFLIFR